MREIKFRAWDKRYNEMIYDAHKTYDYGCFCEGSIYSQSFSDILEEVDCEVMQYTGIKDKNGKEIYEGDIVYMRCDGLSGFGKVIFEKGCFWIEDKKRKRTYPLYNEAEYRIDGNIYENPELLGDD